MKKVIALLLAVCLAVSLFGCSAVTPDVVTTTPTTKPNGENAKYPSWTVSDEDAVAASKTVIATVGDYQLTNGELNVYYWEGVYSFLNNYGSYASYLGLDYTKPFDTQGPTGKEDSWQKLFIEDALSAWHINAAVAMVGEKMDIKMPAYLQKDLDNYWDTMEDAAKQGGYDSVDAMLKKEAGAAATGENFYNYTFVYYHYLACMEYLAENTEITDADLEEYFLSHAEELAKSEIRKDSGNVFSVRHILIAPEGGTTSDKGTTYSDAEWEACRDKAQKLLDQWASGEATDETFAEFAKEHSTDPGSASKGGLYEGLDKDTNFMEPFKNWYLEEGRQVGDYGLVKTDYGYHIMYLSEVEAKWIYHCRNGIIEETVDTFIEDAKKEYPMEPDWDKIALGEVQLAASE